MSAAGRNNDESGPQPDGSGGKGSNPDRGKAIIYARVSTREQAKEGFSIQTQIEEMKEYAADHGMTIVGVIVDEGESGMNFDRPGIEELLSRVQHEAISAVLVADLSRLGRTAPTTVYVVDRLQSKFDTTVNTREGPLDFHDQAAFMSTVVEALANHTSIESQAKSSAQTKARRFNEKNWSPAFEKTPLGYDRTDEDWLEVDPEEAEVVEAIFEHYLRSESYVGTARYIAATYGEGKEDDQEMLVSSKEANKLDIDADRVPSAEDGHSIKRILTRGVYRGKPSMNHNSPLMDDSTSVVTDSELEIVDRELHAQVTEILNKNQRKHSSGNAQDLDDLADTFSLLAVFGSDPRVKLHCQTCDSLMRKNGTATLTGGERVQNFECKNCGKQYRFPNQEAYNQIKSLYERLTDDEDSGE